MKRGREFWAENECNIKKQDSLITSRLSQLCSYIFKNSLNFLKEWSWIFSFHLNIDEKGELTQNCKTEKCISFRNELVHKKESRS